MKSLSALLLAASLAGRASAVRAQLSPITRVVELLKGLADQAEKDGKKEEDLYESYVCWAKSVIDSKTQTNAEAQSRVDELEAYIADLDAGRIELTTERVDLEKEVKERHDELQQMEENRVKENEDYLAAKEEMLKAIEGLDDAIGVMMKATGGDTAASTVAGGFLQTGTSAGQGFADRVAGAEKLEMALRLGKKYLAKGDALFLERVLGGVPPTPEWEKAGRKIPHKGTYKARTAKVQDVLSKMKETFETNVVEAEAAEEKAVIDFTELKASKQEELASVSDALNKGDGENGARAESKADSQTEMDALKEQIENDNSYIDTTTADLATKKAEWKDRKTLRAGEIAAIGKAIAILHSDDARDMFASSMKSQTFFLQVTSTSKSQRVMEVLKRAANMSGDKRLAKLATTLSQPVSMATGSHFDEVIASIDEMVNTLKVEEETDLQNKEMCERDRADDTRTAVKAARTMDERSDAIVELKNDIVEIEKTIAENEAEIKTIQEEVTKAEKMRADEHAEWEAANRDDEAANQLVLQAKDVLARFYQDNNLVFIQKTDRKMDPVPAGEAPPPPPATWEEPYGGKTQQAGSIVSTLEMISEDLVSDKNKAKSQEDKAQTTYNTFRNKSEQQIQALEDANSGLTDTKGMKQDDVATAKEQRLAQKDQMEAVIQKINDATPSCVYNTINYPIRLNNRRIEIDGLEKAKAILQGGEFPSMLQRS